MIIWLTTPARIKHKIPHIRKLKGRKNARWSFVWDDGDLPVARLNDVTGKLEAVDNRRGNAYAYRRALKYRKMLEK